MRTKRFFSPYALAFLSSLLLSCQAPITHTPPTLETQGADFSFAFSPDGKKLTFIMAGYGTLPGINETLRKKSSQLYLVDLDTDQITSYPHDLDASLFQAWSPDSKVLAYSSAQNTVSLLDPNAPEQATRLSNISSSSTAITWASSTEIVGFQYNENSGILRQQLQDPTPRATSLMQIPERTVKPESEAALPLIDGVYSLAPNTFLVKESYFPDQEAWLKVSEDSTQANIYKPLTKETRSYHASLSQDHSTLYYDVSPLSPLDDRLSSEIFRLDLNSGAQVPLGKGFMPKLSPDGNTLAMIQDNNLVLSSPEASSPREILSKATLGDSSVHLYQWHPDSQKLWVFTAPDTTSTFTAEGEPVVNTRYGNVNIVSPDKISNFKLYEIDAQTGARKAHPLDWDTVKADLN